MTIKTISPVAVTAFKWLCSSVLPEVSGEFIASCKAPLAAFPWTPVRLLAYKNERKEKQNIKASHVIFHLSPEPCIYLAIQAASAGLPES